MIDITDVFGRRGQELLDRLAAAESWAQRFRILDDVLQAAVEDDAEVRPALDHAWQSVCRAGGGLRVGRLASDMGFSRRHLTELFGREFGITPKIAARVARLDQARRLLQTSDHALAAIASTCGFADQAHLTNEWHALAGVSPARWASAEHLPNLQDAEGSAD